MPLLDLTKITTGLSKTWAGYLRDWDRTLRSANHPETTRYNYLLAVAQLARYLAEHSPDPDADDAADDPCEVTKGHVEAFQAWMIDTRSAATALNNWAVTIALILALLAVDLIIAAARPHRVGFREATAWSVLYVLVAIGFGVWFAARYGGEFGTEYFAGYIVEKSLSVDNLFVFVIIMTTFAVPEEHQHKVLTFGIVLALAMRAVFIALGAALLALFSFMFLLFGLLPIFTAVQLFRHRDEDPDVEDNVMVKAARRMLPITGDYIGGRLTARVDGRRMVTPLVVVLIAIGSIDLLFALDSIPAVFGVTEQPYIVFTANAFALLGLRALYFLVKGLLDRLVYLSAGLALILAFIGVKLILHWAHVDIDERIPEIPTPASLAVIITVLAVVTVASLVKTRRDPTAEAHPGSLRAHRPTSADTGQDHPNET